jgi:hypothetical protein
MPTRIGAEPIQPIVSQAAPYPVKGGAAIPVYLYTSLPAGRGQASGKAIPVRFITASDLIQNGGQYQLMGRPQSMPVIAVSVATYGAVGGAAIAVYDVTNLNYPPPIIIPPLSFGRVTELGASRATQAGDMRVTEE